MPRALAATTLTLLSAVLLHAQAPAPPAGFTVTPLFDNSTVTVIRLQVAPGAREQPHAHPYSMLAVYLTRADVEMHNGASHSTDTKQPGDVEFIGRDVTHAAANAGSSPLDLVAISIKPERVRGGTAPPAPPPAGVTRTPVFDNADATVTRLEFAPAAHEPMHTHPYDLVVVPLTPARLEVRTGKETKVYAPGEAFFIPRNEPHAVANLASERFTEIGIAIK